MTAFFLLAIAGFDAALFRLGILWGAIGVGVELLTLILTFRYWDPTGY